MVYTSQINLMAGLQAVMNFAVEHRRLRRGEDARVSRSSIRAYTTVSSNELQCSIAQHHMPTYTTDIAAQNARTRPENNLRPTDGPDSLVRADNGLCISCSESEEAITREDVWSSRTRVVAITEFKRLGMVKKNRFREGVSAQPEREDQLTFGQDAMYHLDQIVSYAIVWHTPFVALCDGETVILVEFNEEMFDPKMTTKQV